VDNNNKNIYLCTKIFVFFQLRNFHVDFSALASFELFHFRKNYNHATDTTRQNEVFPEQ
jgi:hypothetical protein